MLEITQQPACKIPSSGKVIDSNILVPRGSTWKGLVTCGLEKKVHFKWHRVAAGGFAPGQKPNVQEAAQGQQEDCRQLSILLFKHGQTALSVITDMTAGDSWHVDGDTKVDLTEKAGLW
jgi:hypothetical protein